MQKENVKTLPMAMFDKLDKLASPRLVEYWEQDPYAPPAPPEVSRQGVRLKSKPKRAKEMDAVDDLGVTVEAQCTVGDDEVVILSARDSSGLETWLKQVKYKIPEGSEPFLARQQRYESAGKVPATFGKVVNPLATAGAKNVSTACLGD